jgi:outer membrane receptor protein involved in Fe transport
LLRDLSNTIFGLYPRYALDVPSFKLLVGGNVEFETADETRYHFYPHAEARYKLASDVLSIFAKVTGGLQKHSYKEITGINPFTGALVVPGNSNNKFEVSGGMNVKLDKEILFSADASYNRVTDFLYYINNEQLDNEPVTFTNVYDDAEIIKVHGQLQFERNEKFSFALGAQYNNNKPDKLFKAWYVPAVKVNLSGNYSMQEKIIIKADMFYNSTRYAPLYDGSFYTKLKPYFDANLGVEYRYSKQLSAFVQFNNIGSVQYFNWYNYPSYRFQAMAGVTYSF